MKTLTQSPTEDAFVQNPYAVYADVQATDPVRFWTDYNMLAVFDAELIQSLLRDRRLGRALPEGQNAPPPDHLRDFAALEAVSMLELEPPAHTRLRSLVLRAFTSRRIKSLAPDIQSTCHRLIDDFPNGPFDLLQAYCKPVPVRIIARLLGVPEEMSPDLLRWSNAMVAMYQASRTTETEVAANMAAHDFTLFMIGYIEARRTEPRDDLITELIRAESEASRLTPEEMIGTCVLLLNAGHEATVHTLGNAVKALLENGCPASALAPENRVACVEEVLRYDPPLHIFTRYAYADLDIAGHQLRTGDQIALVLGAAGRDPEICTTPHVFNPYRAPVPHAAFGGGTHFCVGAPLARLEMQIALATLFDRIPNLTQASPARYANTYHFHGLAQLTVTA